MSKSSSALVPGATPPPEDPSQRPHVPDTAAYWRAVEAETDRLGHVLAAIRMDQDSGLLTVGEAAANRISALEIHLERCRSYRLRWLQPDEPEPGPVPGPDLEEPASDLESVLRHAMAEQTAAADQLPGTWVAEAPPISDAHIAKLRGLFPPARPRGAHVRNRGEVPPAIFLG